MSRPEHWRVAATLKDGTVVVQQPHFGSTKDADAYIAAGEVVTIIKDHDSRIYPLWRANHPSNR